MTEEAFYRYLQAARRELWTALRALPEETLSEPVIPTPGARCVKDLVAHIAVVEDGWFRGDLLGEVLVMDTLGRPAPTSEAAYWHHETESLDDLLRYWAAVEADTLTRWPQIMAVAGSGRRIPVSEDRPETLDAREVLWHVMQHEVRHTAQIAQMLRLLGQRPPALDLAFFTAR